MLLGTGIAACLLLAACSADDDGSSDASTTISPRADVPIGDPCPYVSPGSTVLINGQPLSDASYVMSHQCVLGTTSGGERVDYSLALSGNGIPQDYPPPTIQPELDGTVTTVPSETGIVYLVEFSDSRMGTNQSTRYVWSSRDGFAASVIVVADSGSGSDEFDVSGATAAVNEILENASETPS